MDQTKTWFSKHEKHESIQRLYNSQLIKASYRKDIPLKGGGMTDVYVDFGPLGDYPEVVDHLTRLCALPLMGLKSQHRLDQFVYFSSGVSSLVEPLSKRADLPYVPINSEGRIEGDLQSGEKVAIIHDAVATGQTTREACEIVRAHGCEVCGLIFLIDRERGWKEFLRNAGFGGVTVYAGITIGEIRAYLKLPSAQTKVAIPA